MVLAPGNCRAFPHKRLQPLLATWRPRYRRRLRSVQSYPGPAHKAVHVQFEPPGAACGTYELCTRCGHLSSQFIPHQHQDPI